MSFLQMTSTARDCRPKLRGVELFQGSSAYGEAFIVEVTPPRKACKKFVDISGWGEDGYGCVKAQSRVV